MYQEVDCIFDPFVFTVMDPAQIEELRSEKSKLKARLAECEKYLKINSINIGIMENFTKKQKVY